MKWQLLLLLCLITIPRGHRLGTEVKHILVSMEVSDETPCLSWLDPRSITNSFKCWMEAGCHSGHRTEQKYPAPATINWLYWHSHIFFPGNYELCSCCKMLCMMQQLLDFTQLNTETKLLKYETIHVKRLSCSVKMLCDPQMSLQSMYSHGMN
jgi:hypothetical protein